MKNFMRSAGSDAPVLQARARGRAGERGSALLISILVMVILTLLGISYLLLAQTESQIAENQLNAQQALFVAESGARMVINWFNDPSGTGYKVPTAAQVNRSIRWYDHQYFGNMMKKDAAGRITDKQLDTILTVHAYNYFIGTQEQFKLLLGDPAGYSNPLNFHKRTTASASTRQQSLNDDNTIEILNKKNPKINGKPHTKTVKKIIVDEIVESSTNKDLLKISKNYGKMSVIDGQMWGTLDFAKGLYLRNGKWTEGREKTYQYEMQKFVLEVISTPELNEIWGISESMFTDENGFFYNHTNGTVPTEPMYNGEVINLDECEHIPTIKTQGSGALEGVNNNIQDINKMSVAHLFPSTLGMQGKKLYLSMLVNDIDKIGDRTTEKADAYVNKLDFKTDLITPTNLVTEQLYDHYGIQNEVQDEFKNKVKDSTQKTSVIFNNIYENGEIRKEFKDVPNLEAEIKESIDIQNILYERSKNIVLRELGISRNPDTGKWELPDKNTKKFVDKLKKLFIQRLLPINSIDGLDIWLSSKSKVLDLLSDSKRIEQILVALIKNNVISRKVNGEMLVQEANYIYDDTLQFYRVEDGKIQPMEVMIPIPDAWKGWVKSIGGIDELNKRLADGKLPEDVITFLANRIPTADINTIEVCKIKKFLPSYVGAKIVLPKEIVVKTSSDFDIDKLTSYFNNIKIGKRGPEVVRFNEDKDPLERWKTYIAESLNDMDLLPMGKEEDLLLGNLIQREYQELAEQNGLLSIDDFVKLPIEEQQSKRVLENRLNQIYSRALLLEQRFDHLLHPHEATRYKELANKYYKPVTYLEKLEEKESNKWHIINQWWYNMKKGQEFWQGIKGVAFAASQTTVNSALQLNPIPITSPVVNMNTGKIKGLFFFDGQQLPEGERYTNGLIYDTDNNEITDNYGQALVGFVDVAKDSFMYKANIRAKLFSIVSFLNRHGVSKGVGAELIFGMMSTPMVKDYIKASDNRLSRFALHNEYRTGFDGEMWYKDNIGYKGNIVEKLLKKHNNSKLPKTYDNTVAAEVERYFTSKSEKAKETALKAIKDKIERYGYKYLTKEDFVKAKTDVNLQVQILDNYMMYSLFAAKGQKLNSSLRAYSSATFPKSLSGIDLKLGAIRSVMEDGFYDASAVSNHIENTNLKGSFRGTYGTASSAYSWAYMLRKYDTLNDLFNNRLADVLANSGQKFDDVEKALDYIKGNFFSFLYSFNQPNMLEIAKEYRSMFTGDNSIPNQLIKIKSKIPNELFNVLTVVSETDYNSGMLRENKHVTTFNKKYGITQEDIFVSIFEDLYKSSDPDVRTFANNFFKYSIYQNGVLNSPISYMRILPNSIFIKVMDDIVQGFDKKIGFESAEIGAYFESFIQQMYRNSVRNNKIVPRYRKSHSNVNNPLRISKKGRISNSEYVSVRVNLPAPKDNSDKTKKNRVKTPSTLVLFKKVSETVNEAIYEAHPSLGDGYRFKEYYPTILGSTVPSILKANDPKTYGKIVATDTTVTSKDNTSAKIKEGDIWASGGIPVITTNLGGVHGAGLANQAYKKGYLKYKAEGEFGDRGKVISFPVKEKWSDQTKMELLVDSANKLITLANNNPSKQYSLPLVGLGHGEGSAEAIVPVIKKILNSTNNVTLILPTSTTDTGKKGTARTDTSLSKMDKIKSLLGQNNDNLSDLDRKLYQLETAEEQPAPNEDLDNAMKDFFSAIGVTYNVADTIKRVTGSKQPAIAVANLSKMTLDVIEGKRNLYTLPEEAAHFYIATLDKEGSFYKKMFSDISNYPVYSQIKEQYKGVEGYDENTIREEAIAKLIADRMANKMSTGLTDRQKQQVNTWWSKLWDHVRALFKLAQKDIYAKAAYDILIRASENSKIVEVKKETNPVDEWDKLSATPKGIYKYLYYQTVDAAQSAYSLYADIFGEDNVSVLDVADGKYRAKIAIKKPNITNETDIISKEEVAMENVQQMSKAPVEYNSNLLYSNFDKYFPDLAHLEDSEKLGLLKSVELGETELYCEF